jgi:hypothetical protein
MCTNTPTLPQPEEKSAVGGAINSKEKERERKMCRLVIIEFGPRLRRIKNGYVKKNQ